MLCSIMSKKQNLEWVYAAKTSLILSGLCHQGQTTQLALRPVKSLSESLYFPLITE